MTAEEIAGKMWEITEEFQRQTGTPDVVIEKVIKHCFRKIELTDKPAEYILLLLPDELKNYCFWHAINARGIEIMKVKGVVQNV